MTALHQIKKSLQPNSRPGTQAVYSCMNFNCKLSSCKFTRLASAVAGIMHSITNRAAFMILEAMPVLTVRSIFSIEDLDKMAGVLRQLMRPLRAAECLVAQSACRPGSNAGAGAQVPVDGRVLGGGGRPRPSALHRDGVPLRPAPPPVLPRAAPAAVSRQR